MQLLSPGGAFGAFLTDLFESGQLRLVPGAIDESENADVDAAAVAAVLREREARARLDLSAEAPSLDLDAALWAARQLFRPCYFLVERETEPEAMQARFEAWGDRTRTPATDYAVDLTFAFLPDLIALAQRRGSGDALTQILLAWAKAWPLSSVGIAVEDPVATDSLRSDPALWRLYLDRVVARGARDRMRDPAVAAAVLADLQMYPDLAPGLRETLLMPLKDPDGTARP